MPQRRSATCGVGADSPAVVPSPPVGQPPVSAPMRQRPPYTPVTLWYLSDVQPVAGQFLQAQSRSQATYLIQTVRQSPTVPERYTLVCLRWPPEEVPLDAQVLPLYWAKREKKKPRPWQQVFPGAG